MASPSEQESAEAVVMRARSRVRVFRASYFRMAINQFEGIMHGWGGVQLLADEKEAVDAATEFMCRFDYDYATGDMAFHARVYAVAHKYGIPQLRQLARDKFEKDIQRGEGGGDDYAAALRVLYGNYFAAAVRVVYGTDPRGDRTLRDLVVAKSRENIGHLRSDPDFDALLRDRDMHDFVADLLIAMAELHPPPDSPAGGRGEALRGSRSHRPRYDDEDDEDDDDDDDDRF